MGYEIIELDNWLRKNQYEWFSTFEDPSYGFCVKVDVTEIVNYSKETNTKFFTNFYYAIMKVINELEPFRYRVVDDKVILYDVINPDFSVKTADGCFNNVCFPYTSNYDKFYEECRKLIDENNKCVNFNRTYNTPEYNKVYTSCLTTIDILSMVHPIKWSDKSSTSVPRIFWDKYIKEEDKYTVNLNITVSHALVDGEDLSKAFNKIREYSLEFKNIIKE